jgi:hypothetical protein
MHANYVSKNRNHVNTHTKERRLRVWGKSSRRIAKDAETFAILKIIPRLGFSEINHLSAINRFFPFDIVATLNDERVFIDVTTSLSKVIRRQKAVADALRMRVFVLFVKPDLASYLLTSVESDTVTFRMGELRKVA